MQESDYTFVSSDGLELGGSLIVPEGGADVFALIHSGSTLSNRDGNVPRTGMASTLYRKVGRMLALRGVASFRFDKRDWDTPKPTPLTYTLTHRIADYQAAFAKMREVWQGKIAFVGHSEGGVIAQLAAARGDQPDALAVLASPAVTMTESMAWRAKRAVNAPSNKAKRFGMQLYAALEEIVRRADTDLDFTPEEFETFRDFHHERGGLQGWESWPWLKEHHKTSVSDEISGLTVPTLHVHGDHDHTVSLESLSIYRDAAAKAGRGNVECVEMSELGHFLEDSTRKAFVVKEDLLDLLANWLKGI